MAAIATPTNQGPFALIIPFFRPIEHLILDDTISEIMGNPDGTWWYERNGKIESAGPISLDPGKVHAGLEVIGNLRGKRQLNEDNPLLNLQLPDGSRLAAVIPPVVRPNPSVTIRKFRQKRYTIQELIELGTLTSNMAAFLRENVEGGKVFLISGGTGSGKTTLLNAMADFIPEGERIVVIEDTAELRISKPNLLAAECQLNTSQEDVTYNILLKAALRWRPDRIILGEVRDIEARTLLDSFNTGHAGSMATIHANKPIGALRRFSELAVRAHQQSRYEDLATEVGDSVDYVIQIGRTSVGRRVSELVHVNGFNRDDKTFEISPVQYEK
jgi:pilus assembly protein CpaF